MFLLVSVFNASTHTQRIALDCIYTVWYLYLLLYSLLWMSQSGWYFVFFTLVVCGNVESIVLSTFSNFFFLRHCSYVMLHGNHIFQLDQWLLYYTPPISFHLPHSIILVVIKNIGNIPSVFSRMWSINEATSVLILSKKRIRNQSYSLWVIYCIAA